MTVADSLEQHGCLRARDAPDLLDAVSGESEFDTEYSKNTIARWNELQALALSLPSDA